jgi:acyl dehydratase
VSEQNVDYSKLEVGYEFPPTTFRLDSSLVADYIAAVGETSPVYRGSKLVPPMAIAAFAMAALSKGFSLQSGAIHVSQEMEFINTVSTGDIITSHAKVSRKQKRSIFHILTIDFHAVNQDDKAVLAGKTEFILPESNTGGGK